MQWLYMQILSFFESHSSFFSYGYSPIRLSLFVVPAIPQDMWGFSLSQCDYLALGEIGLRVDIFAHIDDGLEKTLFG